MGTDLSGWVAHPLGEQPEVEEWSMLEFDSFNALHGGRASRNVRSAGNERRTVLPLLDRLTMEKFPPCRAAR